MSDQVSAFNALPRPAQISNNVPNDWVFTIRHVPVEPQGDLVMLVNSASLESHCEGPVDLFKLRGPRDYHAVVAQCLLGAFVSGMGTGEGGRKVAPWTWTWKTMEGGLARGVQGVMLEMGVREELAREVGVVGDEDEDVKRVVDEQWEDLLGTIQRSVV